MAKSTTKLHKAKTLLQFIEAETSRKVSAEVIAAANACKERFGKAAVGVLYYGSCLRTGELDDRVLDFYVIVDDYQKAYRGWLMGFMNGLLPPNVFYSEIEQNKIALRSKFAVLSLEDFERRTNDSKLNISVWARFCQPTAIVYSANKQVRARMQIALAEASVTMLGAALTPEEKQEGHLDPETIWPRAFNLTYGAELRAEKHGKGAELFDLDAKRYTEITPLILQRLNDEKRDYGGHWRWVFRRINGKIVSFLRLIKAAFTFDGGIDYLAWKISRHSGVKIVPTPWQRRHPILGGLGMFFKLKKRGAFR